MTRIVEFVERSQPVLPSTPGAVLFDRFETEPNTLAIAVVEADGRPVGLVERNGFTLKMASHYGRALYAKRPIETLMDRTPLTTAVNTTAETFFAQVNAADADQLLKGFIVVDDQGRYVGVGTALAVLQAGFAVHRARAEEMTRLAQDLAWAEAEALASARAKSQFLAVMSHEIRTPLNGVLGIAELVERKLEQGELKPYMRTLIEAGESMHRLLTDALDLSRADAGALDLEEEPLSVASLAFDLDALWRPRADHRRLEFSVVHEGPEDQWILADGPRLKQVFNNLIGNALKFTETGSVTVRLTTRRQDLHVFLEAEVVDTGPGIAPDRLSQIFEPFRTGTGASHGAGAGLGLAICRQICERMGGRISVESRLGQGSVFRVSAPFYDVPAPGEQPEVEAVAEPQLPLAGRHILFVDDNATNRFVAAKLLEMFGATSELACDGQQAVDLAVRGRFDAILMDVKMPVMDGVAATRTLRELPVGRGLPILALTANADPDDEAGYLAAGMDDVVEKPVKPDRLLSALTQALAVAPAKPSVAVAA